MTKTPLKNVAHLSVVEARYLLQKGIPVEEVDCYRHTVYASNLFFRLHLQRLEDLKQLELKNGKIFQKPFWAPWLCHHRLIGF